MRRGYELQTAYRLAVTVRLLFAAAGRDVLSRLTVDQALAGEAPDLSPWVQAAANAVKPALLALWQQGMRRSAARLGERKPGDLRTYAPGNEAVFGGRKGVMGSGQRIPGTRGLPHVTRTGRRHGVQGDPATANTSSRVVGLMKHPGRPLIRKDAPGGLGLAWDLYNPRVLDAVDAAAFAFCRETLQTATTDLETAFRNLRAYLKEGHTRGDALGWLVGQVRQVFADPYRAFRIAQTEGSRAMHAGQMMSAKDLGATVKTWLASPDSCPACLELDGKTVDLDEPFTVLPGRGPYRTVLHPPAHPFCRCVAQEEF